MDNALKRQVSSRELADALGLTVIGEEVFFDRVAALSQAAPGVFCYSKTAVSAVASGVVVISFLEHESILSGVGTLILSENPRLDFAKALEWLESSVGFERNGSPPQIDSSVEIGLGCAIGPGVRIGPRTKIGNNVTIAAHAKIGADCVIKSGAVIGEDGFGFERGVDGVPVRLLHLGSVEIGDHVEIGSLTTVCRGTLRSTVIEDHAKIDDHVHIAHNVTIRRGAMVIACAEISGGVEIGEFAWFGPNASIIQQRKVGKGALVGIAANVLKDVPDNAVFVGNPAKQLSRSGE